MANWYKVAFSIAILGIASSLLHMTGYFHSNGVAKALKNLAAGLLASAGLIGIVWYIWGLTFAWSAATKACSEQLLMKSGNFMGFIYIASWVVLGLFCCAIYILITLVVASNDD